MRAAGAASLLALAGPASASFYTGNAPIEMCDDARTGEPRANAGKFNGRVHCLAGISDATEVWTAWKDPRLPVCVPKPVDTEQLGQVVLRYLRKRPQEWHTAAAGFALDAFVGAWLCR